MTHQDAQLYVIHLWMEATQSAALFAEDVTSLLSFKGNPVWVPKDCYPYVSLWTLESPNSLRRTVSLTVRFSGNVYIETPPALRITYPGYPEACVYAGKIKQLHGGNLLRFNLCSGMCLNWPAFHMVIYLPGISGNCMYRGCPWITFDLSISPTRGSVDVGSSGILSIYDSI